MIELLVNGHGRRNYSYVLAWKTVGDAASSASHPLESGEQRGSCFSLCSQVSE